MTTKPRRKTKPKPPAKRPKAPGVSERHKRNGRPPYEPTDKDRATVRAMTAYGIPGAKIALVLGVGYTTLHKHFRRELDVAHIEANAEVGQTAFTLAKSGKCPAMTMFWLKTRAGWREVSRHEHSGAIGTYDLSKVSDADLNKLESILGPIADATTDSGGEGEAGD